MSSSVCYRPASYPTSTGYFQPALLMPRGLRAFSLCVPVPLVLSCELHSILYLSFLFYTCPTHTPSWIFRTPLQRESILPARWTSPLFGYPLLSLPTACGNLCFCLFVDSKPCSHLLLMYYSPPICVGLFGIVCAGGVIVLRVCGLIYPCCGAGGYGRAKCLRCPSLKACS